MKIKTGFLGTRHVVESKEDKEPVKSGSSSSSNDGQATGVHLSDDSALIQTLRESAKGQEPARAELVAKAKADIANGLLGSEEDIQQAITALLQEL